MCMCVWKGSVTFKVRFRAVATSKHNFFSTENRVINLCPRFAKQALLAPPLSFVVHIMAGLLGIDYAS